MNSILVSYNLKATSDKYDDIVKAIKSYPNWCHIGGSDWIVKTGHGAVQVRDALSPMIGVGEQLITIDVTGDGAAWEGYSQEVSNWLKSNL